MAHAVHASGVCSPWSQVPYRGYNGQSRDGGAGGSCGKNGIIAEK
jgi:hypothetical protein